MKRIDTVLLRIALTFGAFFALMIAADAGLLPARLFGWLRRDGLFFRWQGWLLAGIFVVALRDLLASTLCRECQGTEAPSLRGLYTTGEVLCPPCLERRLLSPGESIRL